jgi:hypothetical protein
MSQNQAGSTGAFILGTVVGGIVGGILGAALVNRQHVETDREVSPSNKGAKRQRQPTIKASDEQTIELVRQNLEEKIAQLNNTIDEVRFQLSGAGSRGARTEAANSPSTQHPEA